MIKELLARGKVYVKSLPLALWVILFLSLAIGLTGLKWGAPNLWHPDELIRVVLRMGQNLDINPHYHNSPTLPVYIEAGMLVPYYVYLMLFNPELLTSLSSLPYAADSLLAVPVEFMTAVIPLIRFASVIASLVVILIVYLVAERAFGKKIALISCALLIVTPQFITYSKFASGYIFMILFQWVSLLFQQRYLHEGKSRDLQIAGALSGLAMASKYTGAFGIGFLAVTVLLRKRPKSLKAVWSHLTNRTLLMAMATGILFFFLANPWVLLDSSGFGMWVQREHILDTFSEGYGTGYSGVWAPTASKTRGWFSFPRLAMQATGLPIFIAFIVGAGLVGRRLWRKRGAFTSRELMRAQFLLFVLTYYFLFIGLFINLPLRLITLLLPALAIFAAYALHELLLTTRFRVLVTIAVLWVVLFSVFNAGITLYEFTNDTRYGAAEWLERNVQPGDSIGYFSQQIIYLPAFPMDATRVYLPFINNLSIDDEEFSLHLPRLIDSGPDYLVLTSRYYDRFKGEQPTQRTILYDELLQGKHLAYRPVVRFKQYEFLGYHQETDFVSPTIVILKRKPSHSRLNESLMV